MVASNDLNISESGFVTFDGTSTFHGRTLTAGTGISITNGSGVAGNPVISSTVVPTTDLHTARFIVSAGGGSDGANYGTIAAALTAAQAVGGHQTIFIQPGTYTENLTLVANINLAAYNCDAQTPNVTIIGNCTATFAGTCSLSGIRLQTNSAACLTVSGANATTVIIKDCFISATNNSAIVLSSSGGSNIYLLQSRGNLATTGIHFFDVSGAGSQLWIYDGDYTNNGGSVSVSTVSSSGKLSMRYVELYNAFTTSNTASTQIENSIIRNPNNVGVTINGTQNNLFNGVVIESGTASALSIGVGAALVSDFLSISSSNTNAITGSGTIQVAHISFTSTSSGINTTTQTPLVGYVGARKVVNPAGDYTVLQCDYFIGANTGAARAITLPASPSTGEVHRVKDITGTGAANNITISGNGHNIDGAATYVMNTNYGSVDLIYNGSAWFVI